MKLNVKPSQRIKRRYLLIEGSKENIEKAILDYLGALGWAKASPIFVKSEIKKSLRSFRTFGCSRHDVKCLDMKNNIILAVSRSEVDNVRAAFESSSSEIRVLGISGTLKGLTKRFN